VPACLPGAQTSRKEGKEGRTLRVSSSLGFPFVFVFLLLLLPFSFSTYSHHTIAAIKTKIEGKAWMLK
jgi:hypothetical protein